MSNEMIERVSKAIKESCTQTNWEGVAKAAIQAMRESTEGMVEAGSKVNFDHLPDAKDWYAKEVYASMIDAALKE